MATQWSIQPTGHLWSINRRWLKSLSAQFNNSMLQAVKEEINGIDDSYPSSGMEVYNTTHYFNESSQQG